MPGRPAGTWLVVALVAAGVMAGVARPLEGPSRQLLQTSTPLVSPNTTGVNLEGFVFGSEVGAYTLIPKDVCDIASALSSNPPDFTTAMNIYQSGKNVPGRNGTLRTLKAFATGTIYGNPLPFRLNYITFANDLTFMDGAMQNALALTPPATSAQILKAIPQGLILLNYMMHEVEAGLNKTRFQTNNNTNPISGAPHNLDEGWAMYGSSTCGLVTLVRSMGKAFGALADTKDGTVCESSVHLAILAAYQKMYTAATTGDLASFEEGRNRLAAHALIPFIQGTLKAASEVSRRVGIKQNPAVALAQANGQWEAVEAAVAAADSQAAAEVAAALQLGVPPAASTFAKVKAALERAYPKLGIDPSMVGTLGARPYLNCDGTRQALDKCLAKCPTKVKQVCATNGVTYDTACHARCQRATVRRMGAC